MRRRFALVVAGVLVAACSSVPRERSADLILTNARVFTADAARPFAEAIAIRGETIAAVGTVAEVSRLAGPSTRSIDAGGRLIIPGLNDAHFHGGTTVTHSALALTPLEPSLDEVLAALKNAVAGARPGTWIMGPIGGTVLDDARSTRDTLDQIAANNPVALYAWSGHGVILNSAAMAALQVAENEPDPAGGFFVRDASGRLTGVAHEYAVYRLSRKLSQMVPFEEQVESYRSTAGQAAKWGLTSIQDFGPLPLADTVRVIDSAQVPLRWRVMTFLHPGDQPVSVKPQLPNITVSGIKWILDGTPVERLAAMRADYLDRAGWQGRTNFTRNELRAILEDAATRGEQPLFHAVGDAAIEMVLSVLEETGGAARWASRRVRIEHGDFLMPDQFARARALGVIVVQNPAHLTIPQIIGARYTPEVTKAAQPMRSLLSAGIPLALGSDGPMNPFLNIMFATTHPVNPSEKLTREEAVTAYTRGSAFAEFAESRKGMLRADMLADLAVLSQDIFTVPAEALPATESVLTIVGGRIVHDTLQGK